MNSQLKFKFLSWHRYFGLQKQVFNQIQELPSKLSPWFGGKFSSPPAVRPRRPRSLSSAGGHWLLFRNWKCGDFQCCHLSSTRLPLPCRIGSSWLSPGVWHVRDTWPPTSDGSSSKKTSPRWWMGLGFLNVEFGPDLGLSEEIEPKTCLMGL